MIFKKLKQKYNQLIDFLEDVEKTKSILLVPKGMPMAPAARELVSERCDARNACHEAESGFIDLKNFVDNLAAETKREMDDLESSFPSEFVELKESKRARMALVLSYIQTIQQRAKIIESGVAEFYPNGGIDDVDVEKLREHTMKCTKKVEA